METNTDMQGDAASSDSLGIPSDTGAATTDADLLVPDAAILVSTAAVVGADTLVPFAAAASEPGLTVDHPSVNPIASVSSLPAFHTHVLHSGLRVVLSPQYDAATLYNLAETAFAFEERIATGCFLLEAVALVQCFRLHHGKDPIQHEQEANAFGQFAKFLVSELGAG